MCIFLMKNMLNENDFYKIVALSRVIPSEKYIPDFHMVSVFKKENNPYIWKKLFRLDLKSNLRYWNLKGVMFN